MIALTNVYAHNGEVTLDSNDGKNPLVASVGTPIDDEAAQKMKLPALFDAYNEAQVKAAHELNDPLAVLHSTKPKAKAAANAITITNPAASGGTAGVGS